MSAHNIPNDHQLTEEDLWLVMADLEFPRPTRSDLGRARDAIRELVYLRRGNAGRPELTKRELFAAMAMQAYVSNAHNLNDASAQTVAELSIKRADALLAALDQFKEKASG